MTGNELAQVIGRAKAGDPEAFDRIVDAFAARLYGYLYRLTGSRDDADDLLQEVFLRVVRTIGGYDHDGRFVGWLFRIATNLARDRVRRLGRTPQILRLEPAPASKAGNNEAAGWYESGDLSQPAPDAPMVLREAVDALQTALAELPAAEREVVMLRHFSDLSFAEIAKAMGTPLGTALARAHRGLSKLRKIMVDRD